MPAAPKKAPRQQNSNRTSRYLIIQADRIESTEDERAWLDVVDAVNELVYGDGGNGWYDAINLQVRRSSEQVRPVAMYSPRTVIPDSEA